MFSRDRLLTMAQVIGATSSAFIVFTFLAVLAFAHLDSWCRRREIKRRRDAQR